MVKKIYILILLIVTITACQVSDGDCNYYDCLGYEPYEATMNIRLTIDTQNDSVPIWIYEGKYNDTNSLIFSDTCTEETYQIILPLNHQYYVKAKYKKGDKTIYAIDGVYFKKYYRSECDSVCWKIKNDRMDVSLKN